MNSLEDIVDKAYKVFSKYKPGEELDACTACCITTEDANRLKAIPLKHIPLDLLTKYQDAAKPKFLDKSELKYFAPRYLDLISDFGYPSYEPLLCLNRFGYFTESDWTQEERIVLDDYAVHFFRKYINTGNHAIFTTPEEILLMFYKGKFNIQHLLDEWKVAFSLESLLHFNQLMEGVSINKHGEPKIRDVFSDAIFSEQVCDWIFSERIREKFKREIEAAILLPEDVLSEFDRENLSSKYEILK